ncbi:MAG: hypothetical protein OHK0044_22620 [Burkholderiaceae bacterium]
MQPGEMNIDPIEGEFFSTEALGSLADALVREAIQNSLDARCPGEPVRIRVVFPSPSALPSGDRKEAYLQGLWPHLVADRSGLAAPPAPTAPLDFIVVEDAGTRGLQGEPRQSEDRDLAPEAPRNDFYYFWRNVGRSRKGASELGRWGLGKTVFPAASRINAFFALTVRRDDGRRLLMGQAVLRIHCVDGVRYYPYGYFGQFDGDFALPVDDEEMIATFCRDFGITRAAEPGLSVVIPYADETLAPDVLLRSVARHYFVPILAGDLVVQIVQGGRAEVLDAASLPRNLARIAWNDGPALQRLVQLAQWALALAPEGYARLPQPDPNTAPRWAAHDRLKQALAALREPFNRGDPVAVHVPVWVKPAAGQAVCASFDVFLERDDQLAAGDEHFVRDGITIAGVRGGLQGGVRAIVSVREQALSGLLGDSENPAHTEWQERSPRFRERYRHGPYTLRYVKGAPREIVRILTSPAAGRDFALLRHLFSLDLPTEETVKRHAPSAPPRAGLNGSAEPGAIEPAVKERFFELHRLHGGFRLAGTGNGVTPPRFVAVLAAYEVRRGNPFSLYQSFDFEMDRAPITALASGAVIVRRDRNVIVLRIDEPGFQLVVRGFDPRRDVRVKTLVQEDA